MAEEKKLRIISKIDLDKASNIARDHIIKLYEPWIFMFHLDSVNPNSTKDVFIIKCNFYTAPGNYEKIHCTIRVNIANGNILDTSSFSYNTRTGIKKEIDSPSKPTK